MLGESLKRLRKSKGLSQQELAERLNVVRQTVSKWEKGMSVPDSEMLVKISNEFGVPVNVLLGGADTDKPLHEPDLYVISQTLEDINKQLSKHNESKRRTIRAIMTIVCVLSALALLSTFLPFLHSLHSISAIENNQSIIGGAECPTQIYISSISPSPIMIATLIIAIVVSVTGIIKTRNK